MAVKTTSSPADRACAAAPEPRPPHPTRPIRILSEPAAYIRFVPTARLAAPNAAEVLIKSLRDSAELSFFASLFISYPFNYRYLPNVIK
ncbi:MAG: hypothetical protein RQ760_13615 [Sedimentisphaerales bacterium]|nr:hypothetical protein [Sedimentisphaerales bacterium]